MKSKVDNPDADKLVPAPADLNKQSDVVKNDVVKKNDVYNAKIKNVEEKIPDITNLAINTTLNAKINKFKYEILSITTLATATALNAKINEVKNKIPTITLLANTTALTAVENKIRDHSKYIITPEFDKLKAEMCTARLAQANLASKIDIANFVKKTDFHNVLKYLNKNVTSNKKTCTYLK